MRWPRFIAAIGLIFGMAVWPVDAQEKPRTGFMEKVFHNADGSQSRYVVFVPHSYDGTKEFPVILFLHGAGESLGGKKMPVEVGIGPAIKAREKTFPFITVIPQSAKRTWQADSEDGRRAIAILDATLQEYKIDPKRQILTGLSMGGYGTWSLAAAYPNRWAAIVPICGGGDPNNASKIKDIPCWCFHGQEDNAVKVERSREMIAALEKAGGKPRYTEYQWVGHDSWDPAYATNQLYTWLLRQSKK
ncbi:MAG: dienelactone hydrolase family protein [Gemmataceae bacterium]|nr:dienelactone hydrolase family protein [Gemmata sp.]MDW8197123.1 dienelactone hydrolase family protein [Gemmataceae bacterium]